MNEKENHLPNLSDKERAHALELAMKARKRRAVLKARMKSGELAFTDALNEEDAKRIEVVSLLKCVPGIGASKAEAIRRLVKIPLGRRVSGLGIRQREELSAAQSSITSLLSAMDSRAASEQELRECESKWKSLEAEYRARSNI